MTTSNNMRQTPALLEIERDWPYGNLFLFRESLMMVARKCAEIAFAADTNYDAKTEILQAFGCDDSE